MNGFRKEFPMKIITTNTIKKIETITIDDSSPDLPATQEEETNIEKIPAKVVVESNIKYTKDVILIDDAVDQNQGESLLRRLGYDLDSEINSKRELADLSVNNNDTSRDLEVVKKRKLETEESKIVYNEEVIDISIPKLTPYKPIKGTYTGITSVVAIDCEMVIVDGYIHELARCSIVNYDGHVLFDKMIKPKKKVTDYLTWVSGVSADNLKDALPYDSYRKEILGILQGRIIVGHSIKNDFDALKYYPQSKLVRDIVKRNTLRKGGKIKSLKMMVEEHLKMKIQDGQHNSVEDARATMALYRIVEKEWEEEIKRANYGAVRTVYLNDPKNA